MAVTLTDDGEETILTQWTTDRGSAHRIVLYTSRTGTGQAVALANLGLANFSGYGALTPTWSLISDSANGRARVQSNNLTFTHNGGGTGNSILGWALIDNTANKLIQYEDFGAPITMNTAGQTIQVQPTLGCGELVLPL